VGALVTFEEWALRWAIPAQALAELAACSIVEPDADALSGKDKTEAYVSSKVRLEAPYKGVYLWRNNVGAGAVANMAELCEECRPKMRRVIRWGLANDSKKLNERMKSADLIGIRPLVIGPEHVGRRIGQFVSRECKREDWTFRGTAEENAQMAWSTLIKSLGGDSAIVKATGSL
jgi:hypothetical protein